MSTYDCIEEIVASKVTNYNPTFWCRHQWSEWWFIKRPIITNNKLLYKKVTQCKWCTKCGKHKSQIIYDPY